MSDLYSWASDDAEIMLLEKAQSGRTTVEDIQGALDEYQRLFKADLATDAEKLTLARAFPDYSTYLKAVSNLPESTGCI